MVWAKFTVIFQRAEPFVGVAARAGRSAGSRLTHKQAGLAACGMLRRTEADAFLHGFQAIACGCHPKGDWEI